jgi:hypothetical protein
MEAPRLDHPNVAVASPPTQVRLRTLDEHRVLGIVGALEWVAIDTINVDPRYQRPIIASHVRQIIRDFDPDLLGVVLVSEREDGGRYILDGQHRIEAIRTMGHADALIPAMVYKHLSEEREAKIFADLNRKRARLGPAYAFRARLMAGDKDALKIKATVERFGFHINYLKAIPGDAPGQWRPEGRLYAVGELEKLVKSYADPLMLEKVLAVMRDAWTSEATDLGAPHIRGIAMFLYTYGEEMERPRLIEVLEKSSPTRLLQDARDKSGGIDPATVTLVIAERYNYHRNRRNKLPLRNLRATPQV